MNIITQRLMIRPFEFGDWPGLQRIALDFQSSPYRYFDHGMPTEDERVQEAARYFESTGMWFSVLLDGAMIGYICFHGEEGDIDVGYCFHASAHGRGYAFESISALLEFLESTGAVNRFTAGTALDNIPSVKLLKKLGFEQTGEEEVCFYEGHPFCGGSFVRSANNPMKKST